MLVILPETSRLGGMQHECIITSRVPANAALATLKAKRVATAISFFMARSPLSDAIPTRILVRDFANVNLLFTWRLPHIHDSWPRRLPRRVAPRLRAKFQSAQSRSWTG